MRKIFIIDNLNSIVELYSDFLGLMGYEIAVASSVKDFMDKQSNFHPDLIIYDTDMPGSESEEFTGFISTFPGMLATPIIFLTGFIDESKIKSFKKLGNSTFINKNSTNSQVLKSIRAIMESYEGRIKPRRLFGIRNSARPAFLNH